MIIIIIVVVVICFRTKFYRNCAQALLDREQWAKENHFCLPLHPENKLLHEIPMLSHIQYTPNNNKKKMNKIYVPNLLFSYKHFVWYSTN